MIPDPSPTDAYEAYWAALDPEPATAPDDPAPDDAYAALSLADG